ncbi:MAG TPA: sigma-70 family RNA polymerase sigma factor [Abditibacteriaceae bacterium]|jgi:RNA polymerase sigma-B factor
MKLLSSETTHEKSDDTTPQTMAQVEGRPAKARASRRAFGGDENTLLTMFDRLNGPQTVLRAGDREALRHHLILAHAPLVEHCARAFAASGEPIEDLVQEGTIGLIKAVDRFDPSKGVRFSTYACHLISGEMRHYLRDLGKLIHEPGWHAALRARVMRENESLAQKLGRAPLAEEIASALDMQPQIVRAVFDVQNTLSVESLDDGGEDDSRPTGEERAARCDNRTVAKRDLPVHVENQMLLAAALPRLRDLEEKAVRLFFYGERTKTEIARELEISVNYASYLVKRGLANLRRILEEGDAIVETAPIRTRAVMKNALRPAPVALASKEVRLENLVAWIEREALSRHKKFAVLVFRVINWDTATKRLNEASLEAAHAATVEISRRACRRTDIVVQLIGEYPTGEVLGGLNFLALLPETDARGLRVGERWASRCTSAAVSPSNPAAVDALLVDYAYALYPDYSDATSLAHRLISQL